MNEVAKCRRDHNRLGFAYQIGFARLFNRFPAQQPLEINDELLSFVAVQMNIDSERISDYASWQHTVIIVCDHAKGACAVFRGYLG